MTERKDAWRTLRSTEALAGLIEGALERVVRGRFGIGTPDRVADREARTIARHAAELIVREVDWVEANIHPWRDRRPTRRYSSRRGAARAWARRHARSLGGGWFEAWGVKVQGLDAIAKRLEQKELLRVDPDGSILLVVEP